MKNTAYKLVMLGSIALAGCSPTDTPLIDMCQKITQNLVGSVGEWKEPKKTETKVLMTVEVAYTTEGGESGSAICQYPPSRSGGFRTSPKTMTLNGFDVSSKDLISASLSATGQAVKETASATGEKAGQLADDASVKARELADKAQVMAEEAKVQAGELAVKAESLAGEAKVKATELAEQAKIKAGELASQASDLGAVAKEKARAAALEATNAVQKKLEN